MIVAELFYQEYCKGIDNNIINMLQFWATLLGDVLTKSNHKENYKPTVCIHVLIRILGCFILHLYLQINFIIKPPVPLGS